MNPVERAVRGVDGWQQRHRVPAFLVAVVKKFGDDEAGNLVALLTYFAFLATFPLLLALSGILGLVLRDSPSLQDSIQSSALTEFPIIGPQLIKAQDASSLGHTTPALVIGILGALLGGRGLANAVQHTFNTVWNVPKVDRPGFPANLLRTLGLLGLLGLGVLATAGAAALVGAAHSLGMDAAGLRVVSFVVSALVDIALFLGAFRLGTARSVPTRQLVPGAVLSGIAWQLLLSLAGLIVNHYLRHAQAVAGFFGVVLGLLAWFGLQATVTVYVVEADVVRSRRLWPRSLMQPPLTGADKTVLSAAAKAERRRPEQAVSVEYQPTEQPEQRA